MAEAQHATGLEYRPDIDGLRAVAVLTVVGFHARVSLLPGGFVGVDVFFVISGYLISLTILRGLDSETFSLLDFYSRRIRRIFPALILVLATCLAVGWFGLRLDDYQLLGKHVAAGSGFVSNIVLWLEAGYFDVQSEMKPLLHLWSLGIEEQFYLLWPLVLLLARRASPKFALLAIVLVGIVSFGMNVYEMRHDPTAAFYLPHLRFWELLVGCFWAYATAAEVRLANWLPRGLVLGMSKRLPPASIRNYMAAFGLAVILFAAGGAHAHLNRSHPYPGWRALLPTSGALLVIAAGPTAWVNRRILAHPAAVFVGLISYPMYLWHWPLLSFARILEFSEQHGRILDYTLIAVAFLLSWLTYIGFEIPVRRRKLFGGTRWLPLGLAGMVALIGGLGWWIYVDRGVPYRFPPEIRELLLYRYDIDTDWRAHRCYLDVLIPGENVFADSCREAQTAQAGPEVMIWGDSHAGALYPGLHLLQDSFKFRIAQFTTASCPPLIDMKEAEMGTPHCIEINRGIVRRLRSELRPDAVVLAANWRFYDSAFRVAPKVADTIQFLKNQGVRQVIVIGQVPWWSDSPKNRLYAEWIRRGRREIPERTFEGIDRSMQEAMDTALRQIAVPLGASFVSAYHAMCNVDGCLARLSGEPLELTAYDKHHLTKAGSVYFWSQVWPQIYPELQIKRK